MKSFYAIYWSYMPSPTAGTVQAYLRDITAFANTIVPFLFAVAFLFFVWNTARYFIIQSESEEGRERAKRFALYSLAAFAILFSFWGIVNLLITMLGIGGAAPIQPDYIL